MERANPDCRLERGSRIALGGIKLAALKALVRLAGEEEALGVLSNIRRVEVVSYRAAVPEMCPLPDSLEDLVAEMSDRGWHLGVAERGASELTWVFTRSEADPNAIDGLFVVEIDGREMEIVRLEGRIDRLMEEAVADDPGQIGSVLRESL